MNTRPYNQLDMMLDLFHIVKSDKLYSDPVLWEPENKEALQRKVFEDLVTWLANRLAVEVQITTPGFQLYTHNKLDNILDVTFLQADMWDWLGELAKKVGVELNGTEMDRMEAGMLSRLFDTENVQDQIVLDPSVGTGRLILAYAKEEKENVIFYGVEKDTLAYRTAVVNMSIYGIHSFLLNADPEVHELGPQSKNWLSANSWYPLSFDHLYNRTEG